MRVQTFTGNVPGKNSYDFADEIEAQVIDLMQGKPYQLDLGVTYGLVSCKMEASTDVEEFANLKVGTQKKNYHIIRKLTDFRLEIQEL